MVTIRGAAAELRWGYRCAAALSDWTITVGPDAPEDPSSPVRRRLRAVVVSSSAWALQQRPLVLVVPRPQTAWRWPVVEIDIDARGVVAILGPKEGITHESLRPS
jgi:hypothetical protein